MLVLFNPRSTCLGCCLFLCVALLTDPVCLDAAGLEIATILVPNAFLVMGSVANMIKGLSWMAGGSTRSVFNLSFARDNNIAGVLLTTQLEHCCTCAA